MRKPVAFLVAALLIGWVAGWLTHVWAVRPVETTTGKVVVRYARGNFVCVRPAGGARVCGQFVKGTGSPPSGVVRVGEQLTYRVVRRNVSGALLVLIVGTAPQP